MKPKKNCGGCEWFNHDDSTCSVKTPGACTPVEAKDRCPKWERRFERTRYHNKKPHHEPDVTESDLLSAQQIETIRELAHAPDGLKF